ncbi:fimbria/pilus periplasmic chaperone [Dyella sp. BiH032]|uniref:fimbrial biogenesis chaperone n=1 Tax=Dyella sp. BiH032 TaxID=3075430 RepID=UPI002892E428|nr:fimbria/pilus periplasmic chaperone [Dyella sp. BiH032]WNL46350.1 fimbria/pilus periplasmic chaperone [Dyella sp. BiH032]
MSIRATNLANRGTDSFRTDGRHGHARRTDGVVRSGGRGDAKTHASRALVKVTPKRYLRHAVIFALLAMMSVQASARVVVQGTRFVYPAKESEISIGLVNGSEHPVLMKAWIDQGDTQLAPERLKVPFLITPPLVRVEGGKEHLFRLQFIGIPAELPADRESVYWINLLEVPPKPSASKNISDAKSKASMQLAFQYRLKLFYRPDGLKGSPADAAKNLVWTATTRDGMKTSLVVKNDSAYYVSLAKITLTDGDKGVEVAPDMLQPFSTATFDVAGGKAGSKAKVSYQWIDDWGGIHSQAAQAD